MGMKITETLMYKLNDTGHTPPPGWHYFVSETKVTIEAESYDELVEAVKDNYFINGLDAPDNLEDQIQNFLCNLSPTGFCKEFINELVILPKDILNGTTALSLMMRMGKGAYVDQEKANDRAEICADCEFNVENPGCYSCKGFKRVVEKVQRGRSTYLDDELKVCGICKCFTKALVHVDIQILDATTRENEINRYPEGCWKKKELEDYYGKS
jgi:hypothetical protein